MLRLSLPPVPREPPAGSSLAGPTKSMLDMMASVRKRDDAQVRRRNHFAMSLAHNCIRTWRSYR